MKNTLLCLAIFSMVVLFAAGCNCSKKMDSSDKDDTIIKNELIVELESGTTTRKLIRDFSAYKLEPVKAISESMNLWLFTYDTDLIAPEKMLEEIKASPAVKMAEFNKRLKIRKR